MTPWLNRPTRNSNPWMGWLSGFVIAITLIALPTTALAEWRRAETDHFQVYSNGSQRDLRNYAIKLERFDAALRTIFGLPPIDGGRRLPVYLVENGRALREANPNLAPGVAGFYASAEQDVYSVLQRAGSDDILLHEYAHHFMYQNFPGGYPGWFTEGFAEYFATTTLDADGRVRVGYYNPGRLTQLNAMRWLPMETLLGATPRSFEDRAQRGTFYAQSWLLTHYLLSDPDRRRRLDAYLAAVGRGDTPVEALSANFNMTPDDLEKELRRYFLGRMPYASLDHPPATPEVVIESLPASADDILLTSLTVRYSHSPTASRELLSKTRRNAAKYPGDALSLIALARAELSWGDPVAAETALDTVLKAEPANVEALRVMAQIRIKEADAAPDADTQEVRFRRARAFLARAMAADPNDYRVYLALARSRRAMPDYPNDNDLETWRLAVAHAPQVLSIRAQAADAMITAGKLEEAKILLRPVANNPHGGPNIERTRATLDRLEQGGAATPGVPAA